MSLILECESSQSEESLNQRSDSDFFTIKFDGVDEQQNQIYRRVRQLTDISEPSLSNTVQRCPIGQYFDQQKSGCVSCFYPNAQIDATKPFSLLEWIAPSKECPSETDGYKFLCLIQDLNKINLWPDFNSGCHFEANSLEQGSMYDVTVIIEKGGVDLS